MNNIMLNEILKKHKMWLNNEENGERADLRGADLYGANLSDANLSGANLRNANLRNADFWNADLRNANLWGANLWNADLRGADLYGANLSGANLSGADLRNADFWNADLRNANLWGANLSGANLSDADLSGAENLLSSVDYLRNNFECTAEGIIAYKVFNAMYSPPTKWKIQPKSVITENVNANRTNDCGCGINVATLEWVLREYSEEEIWKVLIRWKWLCGVVVPYNTDGKIRCECVELVEMINKKES